MYSKTYTTDARCVLRVYVSVEYSRMTVNINTQGFRISEKLKKKYKITSIKNIHVLKRRLYDFSKTRLTVT